MPVRAALTINDGQATPAAHTFAVAGEQGSAALWQDKTGGIAAGFINLTHEYRPAKSATGANSVIYALTQPTLGTVNGVTQKVRTSSAQVRFNFAQDATDQERKDLVAYTINILSNATYRAATWGLEPTYG